MNEFLMLPLKLQEARRAAGLSQRELAVRSGVGEKSISSFETSAERIGSIKLAQIIRIAAACDTTLLNLLTPPIADVIRVRRAGPVVAPVFRRNRGVSIFRSSGHLGSSLGEPRR